MLTWGLLLSKTAYPRRRFRTGEADWRCSDIKGLLDLREERAVRRNGARVLKDDMVYGGKGRGKKRQPRNHKERR